MTSAKPKSIAKYLESLTKEQQEVLQKLRETILSCIKKEDVDELISYDIPTIKYKGKPLVGFGAFNKHLSFFIMTSSEDDELNEILKNLNRKVSTVQFSTENPIPSTTIKKIVKYRMKQTNEYIERNKKLKG